jgi:hypothetical protein
MNKVTQSNQVLRGRKKGGESHDIVGEIEMRGRGCWGLHNTAAPWKKKELILSLFFTLTLIRGIGLTPEAANPS